MADTMLGALACEASGLPMLVVALAAASHHRSLEERCPVLGSI